MTRVLQFTALVVALLVVTYFGGFFLAHWINDVLIAPGAFAWLVDAVYWLRDHFMPSLREADDIEALYLLGLLLVCWLGVFVVALALLLSARRRFARARRFPDGS
ncbi:hypothetical protein [Caballeronia sp. LZ016]|uniref:hypothetical protein n=1 Tax=Caballeronia sp. LZ016 TaxID=3038554 RepID=UPI00285A9832|nr:hypothetical protein [Caballeronia sp. LZ016]MDR5738844.1 hypothetical protein [Caballeronia sp. LZ016]